MARKQTLVFIALAALAAPVFAGGIDGNAVIGGAIGGGTGAAVGSAIGGRDGAIIGGAIGGATGAAIATKGSKRTAVEKEVVYVDEHDHHDNGLHRGHHKHRHGRDDD
jgi:outer membrane lipoprotein SlyB